MTDSPNMFRKDIRITQTLNDPPILMALNTQRQWLHIVISLVQPGF